jgi:hypothetical protein
MGTGTRVTLLGSPSHSTHQESDSDESDLSAPLGINCDAPRAGTVGSKGDCRKTLLMDSSFSKIFPYNYRMLTLSGDLPISFHSRTQIWFRIY